MGLINPPEDNGAAQQIEARLGLPDSVVARSGGQGPVGAMAFAAAPIFFTGGSFDPGASVQGQDMFAHEAWHVQQQQGPGR